MTNDTSTACSLDADELNRRLAAIAAVGADGLITSDIDGDRHLLRFRAEETVHRRLEAIIAAEAECCSFLELSLREAGEELVLSIAAPSDAQTLADGLAKAFAGATG